MNESPLPPASDNAAAIGRVLLRTRRLEGSLRSLSGSDAAGLHDLTDAAGDRLDEDLRRTLHRIAAIRNRAAHEEQFQLTAADLAAFEADSDRAEAALRTLSSAAPAALPESPEDPELASVLEEERALFRKIRQWLVGLGYLPVLGIGNFLSLLLGCLLADGWSFFSAMLYLAAWPLAIEGFRAERPLLWEMGAAAALISWIMALLALLRQRQEEKPLPWWLLGLPVLHGIGLFWLYFRKVPWGRLLTALLGLGLLWLAWHWLWLGNWTACGYTLLAEWIVSAFASWCWRK